MTGAEDGAPPAARLRRRNSWVQLGAHYPLGAGGAIVLVIVFSVALLAPALAPADPYRQAIASRLEPPGAIVEGRIFSLGSDHLGRDVLSRIVYGTRISVLISTVSVSGAAVIGVVVGMLIGYSGGWADRVIMRLVDLQLAIPFILLALFVVALWGPTLPNIILTFVITGWPPYVRLMRARVLVIRALGYVEAARALGQATRTILLRHILPNALNSVVVLASFQMAQILIIEGALSFLGLGVQPPNPSWGNMLAEGREYMDSAWWLTVFPGLAIVVSATAVNVVGDALRDLFDPQLRTIRL
jgi:peptide/nickel transport system permease protein